MKRLIRAYHALTKPYDVPADHAFSTQSVAQQRAAGIEAEALREALARTRLHLRDKDGEISRLRAALAALEARAAA